MIPHEMLNFKREKFTIEDDLLYDDSETDDEDDENENNVD